MGAYPHPYPFGPTNDPPTARWQPPGWRTWAYHVLIEVTGERRKKKAGRVAAARPVGAGGHDDGRFGRWEFLEVTDPHHAANLIHAALLGSAISARATQD